jgi:AcrR family transcriptional regulator
MAPDERRTAILEVAIPLLREHGGGLTTKQVADAAGIAEGTLFRAFGTKDELVQACATSVFDADAIVAELRGIAPDLPLDTRLVAAVRVMQHWVERVIGVVGALHGSGLSFPGSGTASGRPHRRPMSDPEVDAAIVDLIGTDAASLRLPASDVVNILAHLTLSSAHPMLPVRPLSAEEIVSVVLDGTRKAGTR